MIHLAARFALLASLVTVLSCSDSPTAPDVRDISQLHQLHVRYDFPRLAATQVSFWAVKGRSTAAALWYHAAAGAVDSAQFVQFRMGPGSLDRRPDGSAIATGDSVFITLTASDPTHMMVQFEPSGLTFSPADAPTFTMYWTACGDDLNYDGMIDSSDAAIVSQLGIWKQEVVNGPWQLVPSVVTRARREVDVALGGFTGYATMY